jgi:hypothetical protein
MPSVRFHPVTLSIFVIVLLLSANSVTASADEPKTPPCKTAAQFDPANFPNPPKIDNPWNPWIPGTQFTWAGEADRGGGLLPHRVVTTVTDLTKVIDGVRTVVIIEKDINEGDLEEAELAFHAQDNAGNLWNLGEYPEEYEDGKFNGAPDVWISGLEKAQAGNIVVGNPQLGTPEYLQGWSPDIDFLDCAKVSKMEQKTCVPVGCYEDVMITDERSPLEPESGRQLKYYAPAVGNVRVGFIDDPEGEVLVLVKVAQLSPEDLTKVRQEALKLEKNANKVSKLYRQTSPIELPTGVS